MKKLFFLLVNLFCIPAYANGFPILVKSIDFTNIEMDTIYICILKIFLVLFFMGFCFFISGKKEKWFEREIFLVWTAFLFGFLVLTLALVDISIVVPACIFLATMVVAMSAGSATGFLVYNKYKKYSKK